MYTRVKICGITRIEDAQQACQSGADAIGLVFCEKSPRNIEIDDARAIIEALPPFVTSVALFKDEDPARVAEVLAEIPVDCLQFHGEEDPQYCDEFQWPYIKALSITSDVELVELSDRYEDAKAILIDSHAPGEIGGTGESFDWNLIPEGVKKPIILAGGLSVDNVAEAISQVKPYAVDVSSGVESSKGIKDAELMAAFIHEAKNVNS